VICGDGSFPRKPDPRGLRYLAARATGGAAATLMIGDSAIDWRTARAAPTAVCLVRYGFGFEGISEADLAPHDRVIDAPEELLGL